MSPEQAQINELKERVETLERLLREFTNAAELDPQIARTLALSALPFSSDVVTDYDRTVSEGGAGTYTVPAIYDGLFEVNGKIIGYYNPV